MNIIGNLIWIICGGLVSAIGYLIGGIVLCCTVIGIPFGLQCFKLSGLVLAPFGRTIKSDTGSFGCLSIFANIVWLLCGGLFTACNHLFWAIVLALTIIGIPFAKQHFKLIEVSMLPFGKRIV